MALARAIGRTALFVALAALVAEAGLQAAALFARERDSDWRPGATYRILCVGDSHTYGVLVPRDQSYPAHLQALLDERAPGTYAVLNLGVPGMNTTEVMNRLPVLVNRLHPHLVIVWAGANDGWNRAEEGQGARFTLLDGLASRSRLYRLVRVWAHDRRLDRDLGERPDEGGERAVAWVGLGDDTQFTMRAGNVVERLQHERGERRSDEELEGVTRRNFETIVRWSRAAGVPVLFVAYPVGWSQFAAVNRALARVAADYDVPVVDSPRAFLRVPKAERTLLWAGHPPGPVYHEIARDIVPLAVDAIARGGTAASASTTTGKAGTLPGP